MRQFWMAAGIAAVALSGCTSYQSEETAPTVSYNYTDDDDYDQVADRADEYCEDRYDTDAVLQSKDEDTTGDYKATFACE
ncbi:MAG TPA: hypothetical protein VE631_06390 [Alphaproteobacteria bacterium]|nr:hypothetical protein [Alphaproteobacteria bacterium]